MTVSTIAQFRKTLEEFVRNEGLESVPGSSSEIENVKSLCRVICRARLPEDKREDLLALLRREPIIMPVPGGVAEFSFRFYRDLFTIADGSWEPNNIKLLRRILRLGDYVIDVGAHVGHFTIAASQMVGPTGYVIAVEPAEPNLSVLRRNIQLNNIGEFTKAISYALSDHQGAAPIFDDGGTGGTEFSLFADRHGKNGVAFQATVTTLDDLVQRLHLTRVDFIKIDAEGAEMDILKGAVQVLKQKDMSLLIEPHPWLVSASHIAGHLLNEGFKLFQVRDKLTPVSVNDIDEVAHLGDLYATRERMSGIF